MVKDDYARANKEFNLMDETKLKLTFTVKMNYKESQDKHMLKKDFARRVRSMKVEYSNTDQTTLEDLKLTLTGMIAWEKDKE
jgi:hypothetical protein